MQDVSNSKVSNFHSQVSHMLQLLGQEHAVEQLTDDGCFSLDIAFAGKPSLLCAHLGFAEPFGVQVAIRLEA